MPFKSKRKKLVLTSEEVEKLTEISCSRTQPVRSVERAKIMLASYEDKSDSQIARELSAKEEITDKELNARGTVSKILSASNIKPHKISSYIQQRDPDFEPKSAVVLHTYKQVKLLKKLRYGFC
ncbi:MAG: hypothetical protein MASP_01185 [Candidatus Methanolliviera sp. GoM_asphalt]|nr:MAG: hypothetical protein MASP_01185 [Candidatus Methanolliviera sp. GoM_asphalt]